MTRPFPALLQDLETALRKTGAHLQGRDDGDRSRGDRSRGDRSRRG